MDVENARENEWLFNPECDCLICGPDCLICGSDCLICGLDCLICGIDCLVCGLDCPKNCLFADIGC